MDSYTSRDSPIQVYNPLKLAPVKRTDSSHNLVWASAFQDALLVAVTAGFPNDIYCGPKYVFTLACADGSTAAIKILNF
jgi:hypothetical protein